MNLFICPYKLVPKNKQLNSNTFSLEKYGALIKCVYKNGQIGYADYHIGENFLDYNLFDIKNYFKKISGPQWEQTLSMAKLMAQGLSPKNKNKIQTVKNHFLVQNVTKFTPLDLLRQETKGYKKFKIKMGKKLRFETTALKLLMEKAAPSTLFRLDFNCSIEKKEFIIWLEKNKDEVLKKIEFIEDPFPFKPGIWRHLEVKFDTNLALDQAADPLTLEESELPNVIILKPAIQDVHKIVDKFKGTDVRFAVTHYMDHPVGQMGANFVAQSLKPKLGELLLDGGLMGFDMFEKNIFSQIKFSEQTGVPSKVFTKKSWGLDFILKDLKWLVIN